MKLKKTHADLVPAIVDRQLTLELVRVTERAAVAAAGWRGRGRRESRRQGSGGGDARRNGQSGH